MGDVRVMLSLLNHFRRFVSLYKRCLVSVICSEITVEEISAIPFCLLTCS